MKQKLVCVRNEARMSGEATYHFAKRSIFKLTEKWDKTKFKTGDLLLY